MTAVGGEQLMLGRQLHHPQREVADPLELAEHPQHRHDEAEVDATGSSRASRS